MAGKRTPRGFRVYAEFTDSHGSEVCVQQSSQVNGPWCWIFCKAGPGHGEATGKDWSPHLSVAQARRVRNALDKFIEESGEPVKRPPSRSRAGTAGGR